MADLDPRSGVGTSANAEPSAAKAAACPPNAADSNHVPPSTDAAPQAAGGPADDRSGLDRAEAVVDHLAERLSALTASWGRKLLRLGSRARESAQDFWAEVQDYRQGKNP